MGVEFQASFIEHDYINASFGEFAGSSIDDYLSGTLRSLYSRVENVTQTYAFYRCTQLESVNLPYCKLLTSAAFNGCSALRAVNAPMLETMQGSAFAGTAIESITLPSLKTLVNQTQFSQCTSLRYADLGSVARVSRQCFLGCTALEAVVLRKADSITTLENVNAFTDSSVEAGTGYIYVDDNLVNDYKSATNWMMYASQIKGISEMP